MYLTASQAVDLIKSGSTLFIQTAAAAPGQVIRTPADRGKELKNISIYQIHTGIAYLHGKSLKERANALIDIAAQ